MADRNESMHPRNPYRKKPDFKALAIKYPEFRQFAIQDLAGKVTIDFRSADALRALTTTLLRHDFDLRVTIPPDHLIPTIPNRLNYLLWVEDLLQTDPVARNAQEISGIDIGTGSCCIYALLGCQMHQNWSFLATEKDDEIREWAIKNRDTNNFADRINIVSVPEGDSALQSVLKEQKKTFNFCVCNPPFFDVGDEGLTRRERRRPPPHAKNSPNASESSTEGGEVAFVRRIAEESRRMGAEGGVRIYTTMLGRKSSVAPVEAMLRGDASSVATTQLCQGNTTRWAVAWTFAPDVNLKEAPSMSRESSGKKKKKRKPLSYLVPPDPKKRLTSVPGVVNRIKELFDELKATHKVVKCSKSRATLSLRAYENTWSNQRRKRRMMAKMAAAEGGGECSSNATAADASVSQEGGGARTEPETGESEEPPPKKKRRKAKKPDPILVSKVFVRKAPDKDKSGILLEMGCPDEAKYKNAMSEVMQFLRNRLV